MFIKIKDKADLLLKLKENKDKEIVLHYNCSSCDDEQVTHSLEFDERMIKTLTEENCLYVMFPCTECGYSERFIFISHIQGIEIDD